MRDDKRLHQDSGCGNGEEDLAVNSPSLSTCHVAGPEDPLTNEDKG